jgi:hypothetical protein
MIMSSLGETVTLSGEDVRRALRTWEEFAGAWQKQQEANARAQLPSGGANATLNFGMGGAGLWVAVTCAVMSTVFTLFLVVLFAAAFVFFALNDNWAASEVNTLRAYIYTGKLAPMKPRPGLVEPHQEPKP